MPSSLVFFSCSFRAAGLLAAGVEALYPGGGLDAVCAAYPVP